MSPDLNKEKEVPRQSLPADNMEQRQSWRETLDLSKLRNFLQEMVLRGEIKARQAMWFLEHRIPPIMGGASDKEWGAAGPQLLSDAVFGPLYVRYRSATTLGERKQIRKEWGEALTANPGSINEAKNGYTWVDEEIRYQERINRKKRAAGGAGGGRRGPGGPGAGIPPAEEEHWGRYGFQAPVGFKNFDDVEKAIEETLEGQFQAKNEYPPTYHNNVIPAWLQRGKELADTPEKVERLERLKDEVDFKFTVTDFWWKAYKNERTGGIGSEDGLLGGLVGPGERLTLGVIKTALSDRRRVEYFHTNLKDKRGSLPVDAQGKINDGQATDFTVGKGRVFENADEAMMHMLQRVLGVTMAFPRETRAAVQFINRKTGETKGLTVWDGKKDVPYTVEVDTLTDYELGRKKCITGYALSVNRSYFGYEAEGLFEPVWDRVETFPGVREYKIVDYVNHTDIGWWDGFHSTNTLGFWIDNYDLIGEKNKRELGWNVGFYKMMGDYIKTYRSWYLGEGVAIGFPQVQAEVTRIQLQGRPGGSIPPEITVGDILDAQRASRADVGLDIDLASVLDQMASFDLLDRRNDPDYVQQKNLRVRYYRVMAPSDLLDNLTHVRKVLSAKYMTGLHRLDLHAGLTDADRRMLVDMMERKINAHNAAVTDPALRITFDRGTLDADLADQKYFLDWSNPLVREYLWNFGAFPKNMSDLYQRWGYMHTSAQKPLLKFLQETTTFDERMEIAKQWATPDGWRHLKKDVFADVGREPWGWVKGEDFEYLILDKIDYFFDYVSGPKIYQIMEDRKNGNADPEFLMQINIDYYNGMERGRLLKEELRPWKIRKPYSEARSGADYSDREKLAMILQTFNRPDVWEMGPCLEWELLTEGQATTENNENRGRLRQVGNYRMQINEGDPNYPSFAGFEAAVAFAGGKVRGYYKDREIVGLELPDEGEQLPLGPNGEKLVRPKYKDVWKAVLEFDGGAWADQKSASPDFKKKLDLIRAQLNGVETGWFDFFEPRDREQAILLGAMAYIRKTYDKDPRNLIPKAEGPNKDMWRRLGGGMLWQEKDPAEATEGFWHLIRQREYAIGPRGVRVENGQVVPGEKMLAQYKTVVVNDESFVVLDDDLQPILDFEHASDMVMSSVYYSMFDHAGFSRRVTPRMLGHNDVLQFEIMMPILTGGYVKQEVELVPIPYGSRRAWVAIANPITVHEIIKDLRLAGNLDPAPADRLEREWGCVEDPQVKDYEQRMKDKRVPDEKGEVSPSLYQKDLEPIYGIVAQSVEGATGAKGFLAPIINRIPNKSAEELTMVAQLAVRDVGILGGGLSAATALAPGFLGGPGVILPASVVLFIVDAVLSGDTVDGVSEKRGLIRRFVNYGWGKRSLVAKTPVIGTLFKYTIGGGWGMGERKREMRDIERIIYAYRECHDDLINRKGVVEDWFIRRRQVLGKRARQSRRGG